MTTTNTAHLLTLEAKRDDLYARLEEGYEQIEEGLRQKDMLTVAAYEPFWIALLREYEAVCQELVDSI